MIQLTPNAPNTDAQGISDMLPYAFARDYGLALSPEKKGLCLNLSQAADRAMIAEVFRACRDVNMVKTLSDENFESLQIDFNRLYIVLELFYASILLFLNVF